MTDEDRGMKARDTSRQIVGDTATIVRQTKSNEIRSTYRVYVREFLLAAKGEEREVDETYSSRHEGRVRPEDAEKRTCAETGLTELHLRLWNVKAEWKDERLADAHLEEILRDDPEAEAEVVVRNSRREHQLTSYGKLKLPEATR